MPAFVAPTILPLAGPRTLTSISVARPVPIYPANSRRCTVRRATITALEPLVLSEDNVNLALEEVKEKLGSMFGNSVENRGVGITGDVQLASTDGPIVVVRLTGRFWHKRSDVVRSLPYSKIPLISRLINRILTSSFCSARSRRRLPH